MVDVGMCHKDMGDGLIRGESCENRIEVCIHVGTGIDDCDVTAAEEICVGAAIGHWRWIRREHAAQAGRQFNGDAGGGIEFVHCDLLFSRPAGLLRVMA